MNDFYVVTVSSVYRVWVENEKPVAEKTAALQHEEGAPPPGTRIGGDIILISPGGLLFCNKLIMGKFIPTKGVPWVVGLFFSRERADVCAQNDQLAPYDRRWMEETKEVLAAIGNNHPLFWFPSRERSLPLYMPPHEEGGYIH